MPKNSIKLLVRPALAEALHADERAVADDRVPAKAHRRLDPDLDLRRRRSPSGDSPPADRRTRQCRAPRRPGDETPLPFRSCLRRDGERNLRPRCEDRHRGFAVGGRDFVGALFAKVLGDMRPAQRGQVLPGQREDRGRVRLFERRLPALDRLDASAGRQSRGWASPGAPPNARPADGSARLRRARSNRG